MTYEQETSGVIVRVTPSFLAEESDVEAQRYVWAYAVEIENTRREAVRLLERYWRITDTAGLVQEVRGPGVVGQQPVIAPWRSFRYTSAAPLSAPSGVMVGSYGMQQLSDGARFSVDTPAFALDSPYSLALPN